MQVKKGAPNKMNQHATILLVDDDPRICKVLSRDLTSSGYQVLIAHDGAEMREAMKAREPDLVILDLQLPGEHGLELTRSLRQNSKVGIIILTGSGDKIDEIVGLEGGADDYLTKPVDERELLARVRSVLRRVMDGSPSHGKLDPSKIRFAGWMLDLTAHELKSESGEDIALTSREFQLLKVFVKNANKVMSRDQIMDKLVGRNLAPNDRSIDVLVGKLRKKIETDPDRPRLIKTMHGAGYKFTVKIS